MKTMDVLTIISLALTAVPRLAEVLLPHVANNPGVPDDVRDAAKEHLAQLDSQIARMEKLAEGPTGEVNQ